MPRRDRDTPLPSAMREAWQELRADYAIGSNSRFRPPPPGIVGMGSGADYHYRDEGKFLRGIERSRYFDRNNMIVGQGVDRLVSNIVQQGFTINIKTGDKGIDTELDNRWYDWSEDEDQCDYEGEKNWYQLEALALRHVVVDGDILPLPLAAGQLQMVEAHRLRTPRNTTQNVVHGVKLDGTSAKRLEYWITKEDLDPLRALSKVSDITPIAARDADGHRQVIHLYDPKRCSQRRGVTAFAPSVDCIGMHDDIQFATLVKAQAAACWTILEEMQADAPQPGGTKPTVTGAETTETLSDGSTRTLGGISPGMRVRGRPGVKYTGFAPNIPNPEFFPHATMILTFIAINLGLPVAVLLLDPSNTNFSGWRGAMDQARMGFRRIQDWLRFKFHRPVYRWKVRQWMAEDPVLAEAATRSDVNIFGHEWNLPTWPYIEPLNDAGADILRERNLQTSRRRRCAERNLVWEDLATEIVDDNTLILVKAYERCQQLKQKYPDWDLQWREIVCLPTPDGIQIALNPGEQAQQQQSPQRAGAITNGK
jgi:capsid protein